MISLRKLEDLQTPIEERLNAISHIIGVLLGIIAIVLLTMYAMQHDNPKITFSCIVYGCALTVTYISSVLYHSVTHERAILKRVFRSFDHASIYLLIAGTYTPFVLVAMGGTLGWTLFWTVWSLAIVGVIFKGFYPGRFKTLSVIIYLLMGWLIVIAIKPFFEQVPLGAIILLLLGGISYSIGTIFYALDGRFLFFHLLWHLFVLIGSLLQFFAVLFYIV